MELTTSQRELLRSIPERFAPERIDRLWIFPPHQVRTRESGFVVLSLLPAPDPETADDRRTLVTIRYDAETTQRGVRREERVTEEGSAPPERIERVIHGVLARAGGEDADPVVEDVGGGAERWAELIARLEAG